MTEPTGPAITEEQRIYARVLATGMYTGLALLLITFTLYLTGFMEPAVPIHVLPDLWSLSVGEYLEIVNHEYVHRSGHLTGWWWLSGLGFGDYVNFVGVAVLSGVTIVCYAFITPTLVRKGDWIYGIIAVLEAVVLALAASGILAVGH
jgi:hypothetical protein